MKKHIRSLFSILLAVILLAGMLPMTAAAAGTPFTDVAAGDWFANPVLWAVENDITGGIGNNKFGPNNPCTRAQVVTFLWAAEGKPEPKTTVNPFSDVPAGAWYLKPVLWAVERGITGGTSNTTFSPDNECTRAQIVTFLYAAAGKPAVQASSSQFLDVMSSDWFYNPVMWAKQNDITGGTGPNTFGPLNVCTRGQVVTFLYKAYDGSVQNPVTPAPDYGATMTFNPTLTVEKGSTAALHITADPGTCSKELRAYYLVSDENIATAEWSDWDDWDIDLFVTGQTAGTTTVSLSLRTEDGEILVTETLTVIVTEPQTDRGQLAFTALSDWLTTNYVGMLNGAYVYKEDAQYEDAKSVYGLMYTPGKDLVTAFLLEEYLISGTLAYVEYYVDLSPNVDKGYMELYFYAGEPSIDKRLFAGSAEVDKAAVNQNYKFTFSEYEGDPALLSQFEEMVRLETLDELMFVNDFLAEHLPAYSVADFGYTNIK